MAFCASPSCSAAMLWVNARCLRQLKVWWVAPASAMFFGNISDTLAFFSIAFYHSSDAFMATHWLEIALVDYGFKILVCMVLFLPLYGVLLGRILARLERSRQRVC